MSSAVPEEWLEAVRTYVTALDDRQHEVMLEGDAARDLPFLRQLTADANLRALFESVAAMANPEAIDDDKVECALRVIDGADPLGRPLWFHYDASVLTVVLPIIVPDAGLGQSGELVICPNHRPYRRRALTNVVEKAIVQSDFYRRRFLKRLNWRRDAELVPLVPGNAYLFWGYRSYHATMPVAAGHKRVTVILHYRDVHAKSRIVKYAKEFRHRVDDFSGM